MDLAGFYLGGEIVAISRLKQSLRENYDTLRQRRLQFPGWASKIKLSRHEAGIKALEI